jgi:hypothetical protein
VNLTVLEVDQDDQRDDDDGGTDPTTRSANLPTYTTFPATSVLLGVLVFVIFSVVVWISLASATPLKKLRKRTAKVGIFPPS